MLSSDKASYAALQALTNTGEQHRRPIVLWIGAGASAWAGFPLWQVLASRMHSKFSRTEATYNNATAAKELAAGNFPAVFQQMQQSDGRLYFNELADTFKTITPGPVYSRMLRTLERIRPLHILTTNVDETLERSLSSVITVQSSDIERINLLMQQRESFVCKLHGTVSAIQSMVFTESDYRRLTNNATYLAAIREIFSVATVVFVGYSLRDEYLIQLLSDSDKQRPLFGTGPHFVITSSETLHLPDSVKQVRYSAEYADHRDALQTLEILAEAHSSSPTAVKVDPSKAEPSKPSKTIYYLADLLPSSGTVQTSQTAIIGDKDGTSVGQIIIGDGYSQSEIQITNYSALHDLIVGLLCFDTVCFDVHRLSIVHTLLGSQIFWELLRLEALRVINVVEQPGVVFSNEYSLTGSLSDLTLQEPERVGYENSPITLDRLIRKHLQAAPGQEKAAEDQFKFLATTAFNISSANLKTHFADQTRLALVNPSLRKLLGLSGGTPYGVVPRWLAFPVLRLARVMTIGAVCQTIDASATRMIWGVERLATAAFSSASGKSWTDEAASYVLTGKFNSDVGAIVSRNPALLRRLLEFRSSQQGEIFRKEIADILQTDKGAQVAAAVNSGLKSALTASVLEQARNQFSGLFTSGDATSMLPAVWGDLQNGEARIAKWRERSRTMLQDEMRKHNLAPYSACPCGSGEQLKFCCLAALTLSS